MPSSNSIDWQIESIRVTAFINGQLNPDMLEKWTREVSENTPSQLNKTPTSFKCVSRSTVGFLHANWNGNRLDVILSSEKQQNRQAIAPISEATSIFGQFVDRMPEIGELAPVDRLAFGLTLTAPVSSDSEGLEKLSPSIPSLNLPSTARDFLYRVNIPCRSNTSEDLNLNRLATWSVGQAQIIQVELHGDGSQSQNSVLLPTAIRLELDINTDKDTQLAADVNVVRNLLNELKGIAMNVATIGEAAIRE